MNILIRTVYELGWEQTLYDIFYGLSIVTITIGLTWLGKKMAIPLKKVYLTELLVYPWMILLAFILYWVESGFTSWGGNNLVRIYVYLPLHGILVAKVLKMEWKKMLSLLSQGVLLAYGIGHLGCVFTGCCCGYPWKYGIYHPRMEILVFPIQPVEAMSAVVILIYLIKRAKKKKFVPDGLEYPVMLTMYGSARFVFEFFRDNRKIFLGCSALAFHALFMFAVGAIWIKIANKKTSEISEI